MLDIDTLFDRISTALMAVLIASFTIFDKISGGRYIYLGIIIIVFFLKTKGQVDLKLEPYYVFNILMILYSGASMLWALDPAFTRENTKQMFDSFICFALIYLSYSKEKDTSSMLQIMKWGGYIIMAYVIYYYGISRIMNMLREADRMGREIANPNLVSYSIAYSCLFEFFDIAKKKRLTISSPLLIPSVLVIFAAQSRKGLLIVVLGAAVTYILYHLDREHLIKTVFSLAVFAAASAVIYILMTKIELFSGLTKRMEFLFNFVRGEGEIGESARGRQHMIEVGWEQFFKTPIFGVGIRNAYPLTGISESLHNNYIDLLCCGGIVGFLIYYSRYAYLVFKLSHHILKKDDECFQALILIFVSLVIDYALVGYYVKQCQVIFIFIFLQAESLSKRYEMARNPDKKASVQSRYIKSGP